MLSSLSGTVGHTCKSVKTSFTTKFKGKDMANPTFVGKISESKSRTALSLTASPTSVSKLDGSVDFDVSSCSFILSPRYSFAGSGPGLALSASRGPTSVDVDVSEGDQSVSLTHAYDDENTFTPTYSFGSGDYELSWEHKLGGDNGITTNFQKRGVEMVWTDGGWETNIKVPMAVSGKGVDVAGTEISMRKTMKF